VNAEELAALGDEWYVNRNNGLKRKKMPLDGSFVVLNTISGGFYYHHFTDEDEAVVFARDHNGSKHLGSYGIEGIRAFRLREVEADYEYREGE